MPNYEVSWQILIQNETALPVMQRECFLDISLKKEMTYPALTEGSEATV